MRRLALVLLLLGIPASMAAPQNATRVASTSSVSRRAEGAAAPARAVAVRAPRPPAIDGREADDVWRDAQEITGFRVYDPVEDGEPAMQTMAKVAYDERNLYILVRAYDPHPDSIVSLLSRRDVRTASDQIKVVIDSYFDRRTGYEFAVNPAGVKRDYYVYDDTNEDDSWDGVWDAKATIDSLGWVAEFRIPLSQLRYPKRDGHTFGIGVYRDIARTNERSSWPLLRRTKFGFISQLAELEGITGIASPRRLELLPYTVQKNVSVQRGERFGRAQQMTVGTDIKYGLTSNLTVDATVNPDFGQVEADPAVLNLSASEVFFGERRPFFLEGSGILRFDMSCSDGVCNGLFYSRRIGRAPQLGDRAEEGAVIPPATRILGAAKLSGRLQHGTSIGVLSAVTAEEQVKGTTVEPRTGYALARVQQDLRGGASGVGMMLTGVRRDLDDSTSLYLRGDAYAGGVDFRHRFWQNRLQLAGYAVGSLVSGSADAIARTQRNSVHYFQRPDDRLAYDPARTSLTGGALQLGLNKVAGDVTRFWTGYTRTSPGFEINDLGFWQRANDQSYSNWLAFVFNKPKGFYRRLQVNVNEWQGFTMEGQRTNLGGNINANATLKNMWFVYSGIGTSLPSDCVTCMRGGPALRTSPRLESWAGINGDNRRPVWPSLGLSYSRGDEGRTRYFAVNPRIDGRIASRFATSLGLSWSRNIDDRQWRGRYGDILSDTTHYTVAHLDQTTTALTARIDYTVSPTLSLQVYAQPFVTSGDYSDWRELDAPRSREYARRFRPFTLEGDPGGFNVKQFRSNTVLRWEYRPGSTLFLVWQQGRAQDGIDEGSFAFGRDYSNLFRARPDNTFLVKATYWFSL